jgi:Membrane proteins related to metalloendopeptidases
MDGASTNHKGIDIGAPTSTTIVAAADGTVIEAGYNSSEGNHIRISHDNDMITIYMHCSKLLVSVGDEVKQGQEIGLVGSTGFSTGSHLHFGVMKGLEYVNPLNYVSP